MNRRAFLISLGALGGSASALRSQRRPPRILWRGSWQSVNIGDIGHTPGALRLLQRYLPGAEVRLWPGRLEHGSREFLVAAFPSLTIADPTVASGGEPLTVDGAPRSASLAAAWDWADIMVHGSGSGFGARRQLAAWHRRTGKPYGVFGVSADPISGFGAGRSPEGGTLDQLAARAAALPPTHLDDETRGVVDRAAFMFTRDTLTLDYLKAQGTKCPVLEFGPDSQLGMDLRDDRKGDAYRAAHGLEPGRFICVVPRLRYTPYYEINKVARVPDDDVRDAINARTTNADHARLRDMIVRYVRATKYKVLACAEMTYQLALAKSALVDPLPEDVRAQVIWRDTYWLPDEAAAIYRQAQAVVSMECHSPLIAFANGTPAFYVRQPTDTCKGQMYRDFGLPDWMFEIEETSGETLASALAAIHAKPAAARAKVRAAM